MKSLSTEQVKVQEKTKVSLEQYFGIIEEFVSNFIVSLKQEEDIALEEEIEIYRKRFKSASSKVDADIDTLSKQFADDIDSEYSGKHAPHKGTVGSLFSAHNASS